VPVLSRLFRRLVLEKLAAAHCAGQLQFFGKHAALTNARAFAVYLSPLRNREWFARIRELLAVALIPDRRHQDRFHKARRAESARASLPLLRQPHADHRDFLAGGNSLSTARRHYRRRSGSTPHDDNLTALAEKPFACLVAP
jgi:hypothetical protein